MSYHLANTRPTVHCTLCGQRTEGRIWGQDLCGLHGWALLEALGDRPGEAAAAAWVESMRLPSLGVAP